MPKIPTTDPRELISAMEHKGIDIVIPTRDEDAEYFGFHRQLFTDAGIEAMVSNNESVQICVDKLYFAQRMAELGIQAIATALDPADLDSLISQFVVKERRGSGSKSMFLNVNSKKAKEFAKTIENPVFQPYVSGPEFSVDAYRSRAGKVLGFIARSRDLVIQGESQVSTIVDPEPFHKLVHDVMTGLDFQGHAVLQFIDSPAGLVCIECNPRLGGASTLALKAGLKSAMWFVLEVRGEDPTRIPFTPTHIGGRLVRIPKDEFYGFDI